ncbi:UNKNOWN [Stylonychia lemnae]|uniref:Uncharacterized protein n=1 Tax=Stylonychia lemnae TaxID=5949 RepID=A0A078AL56_STYLE|nr:UNKNOWN [Stylonychia lemnae]|eukprot:CDW81598.1 UNKNOWN [Stylonychia lemnae]
MNNKDHKMIEDSPFKSNIKNNMKKIQHNGDDDDELNQDNDDKSCKAQSFKSQLSMSPFIQKITNNGESNDLSINMANEKETLALDERSADQNSKIIKNSLSLHNGNAIINEDIILHQDTKEVDQSQLKDKFNSQNVSYINDKSTHGLMEYPQKNFIRVGDSIKPIRNRRQMVKQDFNQKNQHNFE